jgi:hypothetical protein
LLALALLSVGLAAAQQPRGLAAWSPFQPFRGRTISGEVMSVDRESGSLVVTVFENGDQPRDLSLALDDRTVLKKLRTPISRGDLTPGHLVKVTYRENAGRLVARRIEVTGKAVHPPMP